MRSLDFGYEVGSVIRRRGKERRLPTSERSILIALGVVVLVIVVFLLLTLIDAVLFG